MPEENLHISAIINDIKRDLDLMTFDSKYDNGDVVRKLEDVKLIIARVKQNVSC